MSLTRIVGRWALAVGAAAAIAGCAIKGPPSAVDIQSEAHAGFRQTLLDIYVPRYGPEWETDFLDTGPVYARIDAERMFTFQMED